MSDWWVGLSDDELRQRLTARGVLALRRAQLVGDRDDERSAAEISELLGDGG